MSVSVSSFFRLLGEDAKGAAALTLGVAAVEGRDDVERDLGDDAEGAAGGHDPTELWVAAAERAERTVRADQLHAEQSV